MAATTGKQAVLLLKGMEVVHLPEVYHQGIPRLKQEPGPIYIETHFAGQDRNPFDIVVPMAGSAHIRIICQFRCLDI